MAGQPRRRRSRWLVSSMLRVLEAGGAWYLADLLDAFGSGPERWERMARWEQAASRMAIRDLLGHPFVVNVGGGRIAWDSQMAPGCSELYVPLAWAGTAA